jgi:hypothetical protein
MPFSEEGESRVGKIRFSRPVNQTGLPTLC